MTRDKRNLLKGKKRKKGLGCFLLLVLRHYCLKILIHFKTRESQLGQGLERGNRKEEGRKEALGV